MPIGCEILNHKARSLCLNSESSTEYAWIVKDADPVTAYVLHRARLWSLERVTDASVLDAAKLPRSTLIQLRKRLQNVGAATEPRWAKALGHASVDELRRAAWSYWLSTHARPLEPAQREAIDVLRGLGLLTEEQARSILADYSAPRFEGRPVEWWIRTLGDEAKLERDAVSRNAEAEKYHASLRKMRAPATDGEQTAEAVTLPRRRRVAT